MKIIPRGEELLWLLEGHAAGNTRVLVVKNTATMHKMTKELESLWFKFGHNYVNDAANHIVTAESLRGPEQIHPALLRVLVSGFFELGIAEADEVLRYLLRLTRGADMLSIWGLPDLRADPKKLASVDLEGGTIQTS